jgi:hypothetical protein
VSCKSQEIRFYQLLSYEEDVSISYYIGLIVFEKESSPGATITGSEANSLTRSWISYEVFKNNPAREEDQESWRRALSICGGMGLYSRSS